MTVKLGHPNFAHCTFKSRTSVWQFNVTLKFMFLAVNAIKKTCMEFHLRLILRYTYKSIKYLIECSMKSCISDETASHLSKKNKCFFFSWMELWINLKWAVRTADVCLVSLSIKASVNFLYSGAEHYFLCFIFMSLLGIILFIIWQIKISNLKLIISWAHIMI